ncbi:MAG: hypothetical protein L0Y80_07570 [Ignavibacteriae bacterium]|nr:hypothetical protein [Ignavibacteriota bacterium]
MYSRTLVLLAALVLLALPLAAQEQNNGENGDGENLQETLGRLSLDLAKGYVGPVVSGFGSDLNAGWFRRSPRPTYFEFNLEFGLVAMATVFKDEHKHFSADGIFQFDSSQADKLVSETIDSEYSNLPQNYRDDARRKIIDLIRGKDFTVGVSGATIIGSKDDSIRVRFGGGQFTFQDQFGQQQTVTIPDTSLALPVGGLLEDAKIFGRQMVPLAAPQVTFGTIFGTNISLRYLPEVKLNDEIGKTKYVGWGIQHNPMVWFGEDFLPLDVSVNFYTQTLSVGSLFEAKATTWGASASKQLGWSALNLTPYVGFMFESSTLKFSYDYELDTPTGPVPQNVTFEIDGENSSRLTMGMNVKLLFININADYNIGKYNSFTAGMMLSL